MLKVFIISLKTAFERRAMMEQKIAKIPELDFEFFDAICKDDSRFLQYAKYWGNEWLTKLYRGKVLTNGEKGCFASHFALWERCIELNHPIVILEDDVCFKSFFLQKILSIPKQYDFIRLMPLFAKRAQLVGGGDIYRAIEGVCGTQGYYLTPLGAKRLVKSAKFWVTPVDNYIDKEYFHRVENLFFSPPLIYEDPLLQSCIDKMDEGEIRGKKVKFLYKIPKEILTFIEGIWRKIYGWKNHQR